MYGFNLKTLIFILGDLSSFTRFSDNLNNNLEVKVTKILTLRFLIDLEKKIKNQKKTKKKPASPRSQVIVFTKLGVHGAQHPPSQQSEDNL